ncbi:MAG: carbamoyltransferase HypF [Pseudomonadota bacterium]
MSARADIARQERLHLQVRGAVQGVGFRPYVWNLARKLDLAGWVLNDEAGVTIEIQGAKTQQFLDMLELSAPPLARIDAVDIHAVPATNEVAFALLKSTKAGKAKTAIGPDAATCPDCLADIFDPKNRRHGYAFTNCTHCGPRYTITRALPYDRAQTSMADFPMCAACQSEYENPADRRFHAQPNACPDCGPKLSHSIQEILMALKAGQIVALKGLGGFHLAVDARNYSAVTRLRARKQRDGKPFAVMVASSASARKLAHLSPEEETTLSDRARPVVIAKSKPSTLSPAISNGLPTLGLMLPYAPLHALLFHADAGMPEGTAWMDTPQVLALVMTSANISGDPLVIDNSEAQTRLAGIADMVVTHDRDILIRADDSVVRVIDGAPRYLRRARGATPTPIKLSVDIPSTLAVGGHLKNTICITRGQDAFLSQHIGDLESMSTYGFFKETVAHLSSILEVSPTRIACDMHPDFMATRYAQDMNLPVIQVQHHHAHIAAVLAEYQLDGPCLGLALDGFGLGEEGESWGGELLIAQGPEFQRLGCLMPLAQPGGDVAARQPWRMGAAALHALGCNDQIPRYFSGQDGADMIAAMLERKLNSPMTSSAGRLFDAACGLLGVVPEAHFEGEAPMHLEALVTKPEILDNGWRVKDGVLDVRPLLLAMTDSHPQEGANLFHGTLIAALADWITQTIDREGLARRIALSGGCFQNKVLAEGLIGALQPRHIKAYLPLSAPANDGGLSLGQAWIAGQMSLI